ncbi:MAG: hypothetical protein F6K23_37970 [Okeania sp. SIO2C9]|uniref:hypothetical protein n=1 Tax=Okeania sp. SIO2C9 TaxID=2607791 RepID=UPI0013C0BFBE|nr:hypothetical protein [Okeania sp. SIO2C9]NEQ78274.1 hypothetical protein [Okeania sp. SIO2C9]
MVRNEDKVGGVWLHIKPATLMVLKIETRIDEVAKIIPIEEFEPVILSVEKPKTVWVTTFKGSISRLQGERTFAMVGDASSIEQATEIDYFITNVERSKVTSYGDSK